MSDIDSDHSRNSNSTSLCSASYVSCKRNTPAFAAVCRAAAAPAVQQSIDISYPPGLQQQTRRKLLQRANETDRWSDRLLLLDSANNGDV